MVKGYVQQASQLPEVAILYLYQAYAQDAQDTQVV